MALGKIYFLVFTALVAVNIIFAEDSNQVDLTESVSRQARQAEPSQERLFFSRITPCNYTATPGSYCGSCRQAVRCTPNGIGFVRRCLPYCNNGRCSFTPDPVACNGTTTG